MTRPSRHSRSAARLLPILLAMLPALFLASCDDSTGAGAAVTAAAGPELTVDRTVHDFGQVLDIRTYTTSFTLQNTGSQRLLITRIKRGCGCTSASLPKYELAPGESTTMQVLYDPARRVGRQEQPITIVSNSEPDGMTELQIAATVNPMVRFLPEIIRFGTLQVAQEHRMTVHMYYNVPDLEIRSVSVTNPAVSARLVSAGTASSVAGPDGFEAAIELTILPEAPWGVLFATQLVVRVHGTPEPGADPIEHTYEVFVSATLAGELIASPAILNLGQLTPGRPFRKTVELRRANGVPFNVEAATIGKSTLPGMRVDARRIGPHVFELAVGGDVPPAFAGGVTGSMSIRTDVPGETDILVRFSGFVR